MVNSNEIHQNEAFAMGLNDMSQRVEEKGHGNNSSRKQGMSVRTCRVKFPLRWRKCLFPVPIIMEFKVLRSTCQS